MLTELHSHDLFSQTNLLQKQQNTPKRSYLKIPQVPFSNRGVQHQTPREWNFANPRSRQAG